MTTPGVKTPRESLKAMLAVQPARASGQFRIELESFWGEPVAGDLFARLVLAAHASGETRNLRTLQTSLVPSIPAARPLDLHVHRHGDIVRLDVECVSELMCTATARFGDDAHGPSYQTKSAPRAADPDTLPSALEAARAEGWPEEYSRGPFEFRRAGARVDGAGSKQPNITWIRPRESLPADAVWHTAALLFVAEFYSHWAFEWQIGTTLDYAAYKPLEHAVWLHDAPRFDDWVLVVSESDRSANGRAVAQRNLYARDGRQIASVAHSGLVSIAGEPR